jgi:hypothetical protein
LIYAQQINNIQLDNTGHIKQQLDQHSSSVTDSLTIKETTSLISTNTNTAESIISSLQRLPKGRIAKPAT